MSTEVLFHREDLVLFSEASHDRSRLHTSDEYARGTLYGEPIVFGILGAFAAISALEDRPNQRFKSVSLMYQAPMFVETAYNVEVRNIRSDRAKAAITREGTVTLSATFDFQPATLSSDVELKGPGTSPLSEQANWGHEELGEGVCVSGRYAASADFLNRLIAQWQVHRKGVSPAQLDVLLWSSYLTGMQMPGLLGTSAKLRVGFRGDVPAESPFHYETRVVSFDSRFHLLHTAAMLSGPQGAFADAEVWSHVRTD